MKSHATQSYSLKNGEKVSMMEFLKKGMMIVIGSTCIAIGIHGFLVPFGLLEGGALGISLILHYVMDVKVGLTFLLISLPVFMLAWFYFRSFFYNGLHGMLISSVIIDMVASSIWFGQQLVVSSVTSAIIGGTLIGMGAGLMLRSNISIGGTDLLAQMFAKRLNINAGIAIFCIDIVIVTIGSFIIPTAYLHLSIMIVFTTGCTTSFLVWTAKREQENMNGVIKGVME